MPQHQALEAQQFITRQFEQLHQVLYDEESERLAAVKKDEEAKTAELRERIKEVSAEALSLIESIAVIQEQLNKDDMGLLKVYNEVLLNQCFYKPSSITQVLLYSRLLEPLRTGRETLHYY